MDEFDWIRGVEPSLRCVEDIKYFLNKPFKIYDTDTDEEDPNPGDVIEGIYWVEENEDSPATYEVCWNSVRDGKSCATYDPKLIITCFNSGAEFWQWKFID